MPYTAFAYGNLQETPASFQPGDEVNVSVEVTNTGARDGEEAVQLYTHAPEPKIDRPVRELKGFAKVALKAGETKTVRLAVRARSFAYFDVPGRQWKAEAGNYEIQVGASSRDLRQKASVRLEAPFTEAVYVGEKTAGNGAPVN